MSFLISLPVLLAVTTSQPSPPDRRVLAAWAGESARLIESAYWRSERRLYADFVKADGRPGEEPCFMWGMGVLLSAYAAAIPADPARAVA
ncbi:MAG: hypothetical protein WHU10_11715, partial [Fimbriimonadales bacterium]